MQKNPICGRCHGSEQNLYGFVMWLSYGDRNPQGDTAFEAAVNDMQKNPICGRRHGIEQNLYGFVMCLSYGRPESPRRRCVEEVTGFVLTLGYRQTGLNPGFRKETLCDAQKNTRCMINLLLVVAVVLVVVVVVVVVAVVAVVVVVVVAAAVVVMVVVLVVVVVAVQQRRRQWQWQW